MKFSSTIKLQNFVLNFTQNSQNFLIEQNIENDKNQILKRFKQRKNNERKKQRNINKNKFDNDVNKRKKNDENFDSNENNNQIQFNKNRKKDRKNRKDDKKFKFNNFNRESVNNKKL